MSSRNELSTGNAGAWLCVLASAVLLSACGGGGGGHGIERDGEEGGVLFNQWALRKIAADRAYARIAARDGEGSEPGRGQTLAAVDSGIDTRHPVFAGKEVTERFLAGTVDETGEEDSHGTAVASVMVGNPSDADAARLRVPRGVAYGADITMFAFPLSGDSDGVVMPVSPGNIAVSDPHWASMIAQVTSWRRRDRSIDFSNMSFGLHGIVDQYSSQDIRDNFGATIAALAQRGVSDKTVFVWSAGNSDGQRCDPADFPRHPNLCVATDGEGRFDARSVSIAAGLPVRIPELRGHVIAVVAIGRDGRIAEFSNRCGIAANWCMAAPGEGVRAAYFGPAPDDGSPAYRSASIVGGTSVAAPMVTGGLAVMKHLFRDQLSNTELVDRLFRTADRTGIYGDSATYGRGLLNLGAATAPVGVAAIALGARVDGAGSALAGTRFTAGGPLGDGLARALAGHEVAAFDSLGAPFWFVLGDLAGAAPGRSILARLRGFAAPQRGDSAPGALRPGLALLAGDRVRLGVMQAPRPGADGGHLSLAGQALALGARGRDGLHVAAFSSEGMRGQSPATGATLSWHPDGSPLGLTAGWVGERETMLGSRVAGAFGRLAGASAFAGVEGRANLGAWRIGAGAEIGTVRALARGGMIAGVSPLTTSAFALTAKRRLANGDRIELSAAQPLRVEAGRARLSVPSGRTRDGRVLRRTLSAGLEPGGRQIDVAARWRRSPGTGGEFSLGATWTRQPGHDADEPPELSLLAGWRYAF